MKKSRRKRRVMAGPAEHKAEQDAKRHLAKPQKISVALSHGRVPSRHVFRQGLKKENDHETETEPICRSARRNAGVA
jgi:hypothetical protein